MLIRANILAYYKNRLETHKEVKIMNKYESVIIINPTADEEKVKSLTDKFSELINKSGKVEKVDTWRRRGRGAGTGPRISASQRR